MPLPIKTLREAAAELGIPEIEIRTMIDLNKIRAIFKKGTFYIAPDEMAKIKRQRKTLPDSAIKSVPAPVTPPKPGAPRPGMAPGMGPGSAPRPGSPASPVRPAAPARPATPPRPAPPPRNEGP